MDYKAPTKEEEFYAWWKDHLKQSQNSDEGRFLIQLNESGNLMPLVQQYKAKIIPSPTSFSRRQTTSKSSIRVTHCWNCGRTLTSIANSKCSSCNWLICTCGACKSGCGRGQ